MIENRTRSTSGRRRIVGRWFRCAAVNTQPVTGGHRFNDEAHAATGAAIVSRGTRGYPFERRGARDLQAGAGLEVDEQQGRRTVHLQVSEAVEHVVAGVI